MLRPAEITKVRVLGLRRDAGSVIKLLHEQGMLQFKECELNLERDKPLETYAAISEQLVRLRAIERFLKKQPVRGRVKSLPLEELIGECKSLNIDARLNELQKRSDEVEDEAREKRNLLKMLNHLVDFEVDFGALRSDRLNFYLGSVGQHKYHVLMSRLRALTKKFEVISKSRAFGRVCLIAVDKNYDVRAVFSEVGFAEMDMGALWGKPKDMAANLEAEVSALAREKTGIEEEIDKISKENYARIAQLREMLEIEEERAEIAAKFGRTAELFVFEGWVVEKNFDKLKGALEENVKGVVVQRARAREGEGPTLLENPRIVGPFEFLVEFYSLPKPNEIDPSVVLMLTFPIIYGMMLGDVMYGLISLLIALFIISKTKPGMLQGFARLWAYAAIPTVIFGVIFDEWMGFNHTRFFELLLGKAGVEGMGLHLPLYHGINRVENVVLLLVLTIITGMIHLSLGLVIGAINEWNHNRVHAHAKLGWVLVEWGGFFVLSTALFRAFGAELMYLGAVSFLIGTWLIVRADGLFGIIEIPSIAGNTMSYARIAAVGIAGVIPAEFVINKLLLPSGDIVTALILLPIFIGAHVFNVILGMFESLVQGARLNLVEFYAKFFHGSGRKFSPFRVERVHTEEE